MNKNGVIGITGPSGSGKSEVSSYLRNLDFKVINADLVSRQVVDKGKPALAEIIAEFGERIVASDNSLDRKALGAIVFTDEQKKHKLESIIFPYIMEEIGKEIAINKAVSDKPMFLDAPTLFESGANSICYKVISVIADKDVRIMRIMARDNIDCEQAEKRMSAQPDDEYYVKQSDFVVYNNDNVEKMIMQIRDILKLMNIRFE